MLPFPDISVGKESTCNAGLGLGSIPGLGRSPGEGKGYPLQYSGLENPMDCIVHWVTELDTTERLSLSLAFITHFNRQAGIPIGTCNRASQTIGQVPSVILEI